MINRNDYRAINRDKSPIFEELSKVFFDFFYNRICCL